MGLLCYKFANEYLTQTGERILLTVVIKNHILKNNNIIYGIKKENSYEKYL